MALAPHSTRIGACDFHFLLCPSSAPPPPLPHPSQPIWHTMQHELLSFLVPFFMANHPNSAGVLHFAWQGAAVSGVRRFVRDEG